MKKFITKKIIPIMLLITLISYTAPVLAFTKDETVYSKLDTNGKQYKTIVSTHIKNENNLEKITDLTNLLNIENTSGDETFSKDGDTLIWDAKGNDIYYQGETEEKLPIELEIKYKLDGNEISAQDIVGKSGKVTIKLEYKNNDEHIVNVNGRNEKMYTPFMVVSGTILKNNNNKNIQVTNGKVIDDGTKSIIMGIVLPGLQESLNISKDIINIPSDMEISMDSTDFELNNIITFASPKVLDENASNMTGEMKELCSKVNLIKEATEKLKAGTDTLKTGTEEYSQKSELFNSKMKDLQNGVGYINSQYTAFDAGVNKLNLGAAQLYEGAQKLPETLSGIVTSLDTIESNQNALLTSIPTKQGLIPGLNQSILTDEEIGKLQELVQSGNLSVDLFKKISMSNATMKVTAGVLTQTNAGIGQMKAGIENELTSEESNLSKLNAGITAIYDGVSDLATNSSKIKGGLGNLNSSTTALKSADDALTEGAKTISAGVNELSVGVTSFNNEINKYLNGTISQIATRAEKLSEDYNNFTKINEQANGKVKFIIMTDSLKKEEKK